MSTDPDPQSTFWVVAQNFIIMKLYTIVVAVLLPIPVKLITNIPFYQSLDKFVGTKTPLLDRARGEVKSFFCYLFFLLL